MNIPLSVYRQTRSVSKKINHLESILRLQTNLSSAEIDSIIETYMPSLIPPGTKGAIRGKMFEGIVRDAIMDLGLPSDEFSIMFDSRIDRSHEADGITETPDFFIKHSNNQRLYGMVQIDLWSGGAQVNRGMKYIFNNDCPDTKLVCVVCARPPESISDDCKISRMIRHGFNHDRLCYVSGLGRIIHDFFSKTPSCIQNV